MAKRTKRIEKGTESLKKEIEKHLSKLEDDVKNGNMELGRYHAKEIENSLIEALEIKIEILKTKDDSVQKFKERLNKLKKELESNLK